MATAPAILLLIVALLHQGCATMFGEGGAQRLIRIAGASANIAATRHLSRHPEDRNTFLLAQVALAALRGNTNATPADIARALEGLPMLRDSEGAVYVSALMPIVWDELKQTATVIERVAWLQQLITELDNALAGALRFTAPKP